MGFRFRCPKCNTTSFSIERDQRSYAPRGQTHELIFSCRCGRQLFGDAIEAEYLRQKAEWEASATERKKAGGDRSRTAASDADLDAAYERQRAARLKREQEEAQVQEARRQEEDRVWRERVAQATADSDDDDDLDDDVDVDATPPRAPVASRPDVRVEPKLAAPASQAGHDDHDHDHDHDHDDESVDEDSEDAPGEPSDRCGWKDCENPPRPNSKYCSRDCSNKNARSRYKRRRGREAA